MIKCALIKIESKIIKLLLIVVKLWVRKILKKILICTKNIMFMGKVFP